MCENGTYDLQVGLTIHKLEIFFQDYDEKIGKSDLHLKQLLKELRRVKNGYFEEIVENIKIKKLFGVKKCLIQI